MKYSWIQLDSAIPEFGIYDENELDELVDWFMGYDDYDEADIKKWKDTKQSLLSMELGIMCKINGYRVVKIVQFTKKIV